MMQTIEEEFDMKKICKKIISLDMKIRFTGIINERGRLVTGAVNDKIDFLVDKKDRKMLFMEVALRTRMRQEFDYYLGLSNFSITHRENVIIMKFPFRNKTLYVSAEKSLELDKVPFEILGIIKNLVENES